MRFRGLKSLVIAAFLMASPVSAEPVRLYIDADFSHGAQAAEAIELGVRTALREVGGRVGDLSLDVMLFNNRANAKRSLQTLRTFVSDPEALAVIGGVQSPPYLTNRKFINENGILLLLPWSAAGPVTRAAEGQTNWIFRVSIDDTKSAEFLVGRVVDVHNCTRPGLLLMDTGWGRVNRIALLKSFEGRLEEQPGVWMFSGTVGATEASRIAVEVREAGIDCAIMLANDANGALIVRKLFTESAPVRVISHWGIMAGDFPGSVANEIREEMQIEVLQTCGLHAEEAGRPEVKRALDMAGDGNTVFRSLSDVPSVAGFVHGYDLTRILVVALGQAVLSEDWAGADMQGRRALLRHALENLQKPVEGILKTYNRPFRRYSISDPDAHEALGLSDLCVAGFSRDGRLVLPDRGASLRQ
ncbi:ABC transporter substrate-binding protein [uncultured Roseobacter sp.]|uniref:ABC transporter substrate-binding protein n=1 Tax=uncultured Roseobacter sp. TaxID=114847 RepID=UPI002636D788|nr:ABC transporter substrate-binding protein [uncultured Roseobacter sp.]